MTVWWVHISEPAEYNGSMGIYFYLLLADALTLAQRPRTDLDNSIASVSIIKHL